MSTEQQRIADYSGYGVGDVSPEFGRKIKTIIAAENLFLVFLDENDAILLEHDQRLNIPPDAGKLVNAISSWESVCNRLLSRDEAFDYKCLLAKGYVRLLGDRDADAARALVGETGKRIAAHGQDILRQRYLLASLACTAVVAVTLLGVLMARTTCQTIFTPEGYHVLVASLFGGIGAFVSTVLRSRQYAASVFSPPRIHQIDGMLRIAYGVIAGGVVALGIKADLLFGFINQAPRTIFVLAFLAAVSGASEMIVPSIIARIEKEVCAEDQGKTDAGGAASADR